MDQGWIKLHRKLLKNPISNKADYLSVWIHLLLLANHEPTSFIWNNKRQTLRKGQLLTGRKKLSKKTGVTEGQIYKILKYLEKEQQIRQDKTTKFTVITILNWDEYQKKDEKSNNSVTTTQQQSNTYKNNKKDKNDKKEKIYASISGDTPEAPVSFFSEDGTWNPIDMSEFYSQSKGLLEEYASKFIKQGNE